MSRTLSFLYGYLQHTEQKIVLNNSSFDVDKYLVCGLEERLKGILLRANNGAMNIIREYEGKDFTDEIKNKVYWMWNADFNKVVFTKENLEKLIE